MSFNIYRVLFLALKTVWMVQITTRHQLLKKSPFQVSLCLAGTKRPKNVPLWSYFGGDVPEHNRTKIGRIRFLNYFGSAMSDLHLGSGNIEKFPRKPILWVMIKLMSWGRPKDVTLRVSLWEVFRAFLGCFSKTGRI